MGAGQQIVHEVTQVGPKRPGTPTDTSAPLLLTSERLRVWGARVGFSLVDQGLFSGAGFLVNLLLARWLVPASYGAFAVAFAGFLFISGFHNVLILEPLTVMGPGRHSDNLPAYFRAQFLIHFLLVGWLAIAGLLGGVALSRVTPDSPLVGAIFGSALMLPLLLLLWLVRRVCYVLQIPRLAVAGTASYFVLVVAGLLTLRHFGWATPFFSFLLMGGASLVASGVLLARIGFFRDPKVSSDISWQATLRENWTYGRWLVGSTILAFANGQAQTFVVAGMIGLGAAGVLRAMQLPSLLMTQALTAGSLLILPNLSYDLGRANLHRLRRKALLTSLFMGLAASLFSVALFFLSGTITRLFYGGRYSESAWLIPVLALMTVGTGLSFGFSMLLRLMRKTHVEFLAFCIAGVLSLASAFLFSRAWGVRGVAISMVFGSMTFAAITFAFCRRLGSEIIVEDEPLCQNL